MCCWLCSGVLCEKKLVLRSLRKVGVELGLSWCCVLAPRRGATMVAVGAGPAYGIWPHTRPRPWRGRTIMSRTDVVQPL